MLVCLSVSLSLSLSLSLIVSISLSLSLSVYSHLSLILNLHHSHSIYLSIYLSIYFPYRLNAPQQRGKSTPNECHNNDTKQSEGEVPLIPELSGVWRTPSLPSPPSPLCPWVVTPDRVLPMGQKYLKCVLRLNWSVWNVTVFKIETVLMLNSVVWNKLIICIKIEFATYKG